MSSERRIRASRANGAKSRGPKTTESKARSTANSLRRGLLARSVVFDQGNVPGLPQVLLALERDFQPRSEFERELVLEMAGTRWRRIRLWAIEQASVMLERKNDAISHDFRRLELLSRYEARFSREFTRSLTLLVNGRPGSVAPPQNVFDQTNLVPESDTYADAR